jgi:hypothetical protein
MPLLLPLSRPQRRRIHKIIHATLDKGHARRLMTILLLHYGRLITNVYHLTGAARSAIGRWFQWYREKGVDALEALPSGRAPILPVAKIVTLLVLLIQFSPQYLITFITGVVYFKYFCSEESAINSVWSADNACN